MKGSLRPWLGDLVRSFPHPSLVDQEAGVELLSRREIHASSLSGLGQLAEDLAVSLLGPFFGLCLLCFCFLLLLFVCIASSPSLSNYVDL